MKRSTVYVVCLLLLFGFFCAYSYLHTVPAACASECATMHRAIVDGSANSPYRYRVLPAVIAGALAPNATDGGILVGYVLAHFLVFPTMMLTLYAWLRRWLASTQALLGCLMVAALMPVMLQVWGVSLSTPLEVMFLGVGLLLIERQPRGFTPALAALIVVAAFNRETAILLPLAYATTQVTRWRTPGYWLRGALFSASWLAVFVGLRLALGSAPDDVPVVVAWALNTGGGWHTQEAVFKNLFFLPIWWLYLKQFRGAPPFLRRLAPVALVYLVLFLAFGFWNEVRLWMPMLVLTLPIALARLKLASV